MEFTAVYNKQAVVHKVMQAMRLGDNRQAEELKIIMPGIATLKYFRIFNRWDKTVICNKRLKNSFITKRKVYF